MRSRVRSFIAATAVTVAAVTGGVVAAAPAGAAPPPKPIPRLSILGESSGVFGNHDFCRGTVSMNFTSPKRAVTRVTVRSNGFIGNGPGWVKNPRCRVLFQESHTSAIALLPISYFPAAFGPKPGETVTRDFVTGSGLVSISVGAVTQGTPVVLPQGYPAVSSYLIVP
jgi:hypothetical protein